jgi:hypothetical protein
MSVYLDITIPHKGVDAMKLFGVVGRVKTLTGTVWARRHTPTALRFLYVQAYESIHDWVRQNLQQSISG